MGWGSGTLWVRRRSPCRPGIDPLGHDQDDERLRDVASEWLEIAATSSEVRVAHYSALLLSDLLRMRDEAGDADAAAMYEALAERLATLNL